MPKSSPVAVADGGQRGPRFRERARPRPSGRWCRPRWRCGVPTAMPRRRSPTSAGRRASPARCSTSTSRQGRRAVRSRAAVDPGRAEDRASGAGAGAYDVHAVIAQALRSLERSMARNPRDLDRRDDSGGLPPGAAHPLRRPSRSTSTPTCSASCSPGQRSTASSPAHVDVPHLSRLAQMHVSEGVRHWALGGFGERSFAEVVAATSPH